MISKTENVNNKNNYICDRIINCKIVTELFSQNANVIETPLLNIHNIISKFVNNVRYEFRACISTF